VSTSEISELRRTLGQLRQCLGSVRTRYGNDTPVVRRLVNDLERLDIDVDELDTARPVPQQQKPDRSEVVVVPDTPYDPSLWQGADDEGVGGYHRDQP
jgi:hypothetical protein